MCSLFRFEKKVMAVEMSPLSIFEREVMSWMSGPEGEKTGRRRELHNKDKEFRINEYALRMSVGFNWLSTGWAVSSSEGSNKLLVVICNFTVLESIRKIECILDSRKTLNCWCGWKSKSCRFIILFGDLTRVYEGSNIVFQNNSKTIVSHIKRKSG